MAKNKVGSILLDTLCISECISRSGLLVDQLLSIEGVAHAPGHAYVVSAVHEEVVHNHLQTSYPGQVFINAIQHTWSMAT